MSSIATGLIALAVGAVFCLRGVIAMRFAIALWGALLGLGVGSGTIAAIVGESVLSTLLGWVVGIAVSLIFAVLAYVYYSVAVILAVGSVGFVLGALAMVMTDATWDWAVIVGGIAGGVALAIVAIAADLPAMLLVLVTAVGGGIVMTSGIMLMSGVVSVEDVLHTSISRTAPDQWWWYALDAVFIVTGIVAQSASLGDERAIRQHWNADA